MKTMMKDLALALSLTPRLVFWLVEVNKVIVEYLLPYILFYCFLCF